MKRNRIRKGSAPIRRSVEHDNFMQPEPENIDRSNVVPFKIRNVQRSALTIRKGF